VWKLEEKVYDEKEIDLRDLFKTIWDKRLFILVFTFLVTLISLVYVYFKNPVPIYQGKAYIEIGEIQSQNFGQSFLDTPANLAEILNLEFKVNASSSKKATNLLEISSNDKDKQIIKNNLESSIEFVLNRHKEKAKFYENLIMSKQIGDISISDQAINKPKKIIIVVVAFVTGFILSIFMVFFIQFVSGLKNEVKINE
jgi:LPS O-antigen subunit length determinant protein (WzzB/FepE family)